MSTLMLIPRNCAVLVALLFAALFAALPASEEPKAGKGERRWNFEGEKQGALPKGFTNEAGEWKLAADPTAPSKDTVLAQMAKSDGATFNLALVSDSSFKDVEITVALRAVAGKSDQGGGVVWRARDAKNYYIARYNPLENNFRVYKVADGQRTQLATADVEAKEGWRTMRVTMSGEHILCFLDGKQHLEANDKTFQDAGKIGLWTKADAQTHFDDLMASPAKAKGD